MVANAEHTAYSHKITQMIEESAKLRGTGIAKRSPDYISKKITEGKAIIAVDEANDQIVGFCYIETWQHQKYVANSGLIVHLDYRGKGVSYQIKKRAFKLARKLYPQATIFGLTTSAAVMKINQKLGYSTVPFSELTSDKTFWDGCKSCVNHHILESKNHQNCLCTGMIYKPRKKKEYLQSLKNNLKEKLGDAIHKDSFSLTSV